MKPDRWHDAGKKIFPRQVGFTALPHDFDAAPHDCLKFAPEGVGVHRWLTHVDRCAHPFSQRVENFPKRAEVPQRPVGPLHGIEQAIGKRNNASDCALFWNIVRTRVRPSTGSQPRLLASLQGRAS